jgi:hypothetical protein
MKYPKITNMATVTVALSLLLLLRGIISDTSRNTLMMRDEIRW